MAINCFSCKWHRIRQSGSAAIKKMGITVAVLDRECEKCLAAFVKECEKSPKTCFSCAWKDRNLPYEAREKRCRACVEAFVAKTDHDCMKCPWNDPKRRMPSVETLAHCKACLAISTGKTAMNCENCDWRKMPEAIRRPHCMSCSLKFTSNLGVKGSINELSNKGKTIISYDNHNANMVDDRDTVTKIADDYTTSRKSESGENTVHPVFHLADRSNMSVAEFAEDAYEKMKRFLFEFGQLTDMQALLFLSEVKGEKKTVFAKNHNLTDTAVNSLYKQILFRSTVFRDFIILSRGTIEGTRGRKPKNGNRMGNIPKKIKKTVYLGSFQPTFNI